MQLGSCRGLTTVAAACLAAVGVSSEAFAQGWPDLSKPPSNPIGGGEKDAAVVVGIERYAYLSPVPGADENAEAWYRYLVKGRRVPSSKVELLRNEEATHDFMLQRARQAAKQVEPGGTLWFVFIGHGAPTPDGKDGLLVGVEAQQKANVLFTGRSLEQKKLFAALSESKGAQSIRVVLDACFSGRDSRGQALVQGLQPAVVMAEVGLSDPRLTLLTAAKANEFAGSLPGAGRPAFSYLALGGLRGWADDNNDGRVTAVEVERYTQRALRMVVKNRSQTPTRLGPGDRVWGRSARESGPDLAEMVVQTKQSFGAGLNRFDEQVQTFDRITTDIPTLEGYDVDLLAAVDAATRVDEDPNSTWKQRADAWLGLANFRDGAHEYAKEARERAEALQKQYQATAALTEKYNEDFEKLDRILATSDRLVPRSKKADLVEEFRGTYLPYRKRLGDAWKELAPMGMVLVPAGGFVRGCDRSRGDCGPGTLPATRQHLPSFFIDRTEVTVKAYGACVTAGGCTAPVSGPSTCNYGQEDRANHPVNCLSWAQARSYCEWADKRLPTESEWEKAARGEAGLRYPWGDEPPGSNPPVANVADRGTRVQWRLSNVDDGYVSTAPVGSFPQGLSPYGAVDMAGNVWEFTSEWFDLEQSVAVRGGSFSYNPAYLQASARFRVAPEAKLDDLGFRCVKSAGP